MNFFSPLLCQQSPLSSHVGIIFSYLPGKPDNPVTTHAVAGINVDVRQICVDVTCYHCDCRPD